MEENKSNTENGVPNEFNSEDILNKIKISQGKEFNFDNFTVVISADYAEFRQKNSKFRYRVNMPKAIDMISYHCVTEDTETVTGMFYCIYLSQNILIDPIFANVYIGLVNDYEKIVVEAHSKLKVEDDEAKALAEMKELASEKDNPAQIQPVVLDENNIGI